MRRFSSKNRPVIKEVIVEKIVEKIVYVEKPKEEEEVPAE
tara:strand:- start:3275 stop:3394 length:120 start_codon:yes stop_codon:yes gene_type:complete